MSKDFGELIKEARIKKKLTIQDLCDDLPRNISVTYISKIESGHDLPTFNLVNTLCLTLDLDFKTILKVLKKEKIKRYESTLDWKIERAINYFNYHSEERV